MNTNTKTFELTFKDLVVTGIFSSLYIVFMFIGGVFFAPNPVLTFLTPLGMALFTGPVYLLFVSMTGRHGAVTLLGTLTGAVIFISGMFWLWALVCPVLAFGADFVAKLGNYRKKTLNVLSFLLFSLNPMGSYIMLVINPDAYSRYLLGKGTDPAYMQAMLARFQTWMIPGMAVGTLICAAVSSLFGCYLLKKQFERAGITR